MKTFKLNEHSIFPRPFGVRGQMYLGVGIMVFFDLTDGSVLYTEQDLWKAVPEQLGAQPILDQGIPKARGEVLAAGSCFAPRGETRPASKARIRVGEVDKTINVYGDRYWKNGLITEAEPFVEMPLVWANAFGGEGVPTNPLGKGKASVMMPDGSTAVPLPNLELPNQQIGSPGDAPAPACFADIDTMWPQRAGKNGTYDDKWLKERWPYFPDDMNYEFFNVGSEDQFITDFFRGGEPVTVENMNPDMPYIESSLPKLRMRCFATLDPEFAMHTFPTGPLPSQQLKETDEFREISTKLETVWLFPSILRGVALYRGSTEIMDEEYMDVKRLLVRHESMDEEPRSIEHYRDLQVQLLDRGVEIDMTPFESAATKAREMMVKAKNIKKSIALMKQKALGKAPAMPPPEPEEMMTMAKRQLAEHSANLDSLESMAKKMHAEHGHRVAMDLTVFDRMRGKLVKAEDKIGKAVTKMSDAKARLEKVKDKAIKKVGDELQQSKANLPKGADVDVDSLMPSANFPFDRKVNPWHDAGFPLVTDARKRIRDEGTAVRAVKKLGLKRTPVSRSWMGWNDSPVVCEPTEWGLEEGESFTIPAGLVLPQFDEKKLTRIRVFPDPTDTMHSVLVPGSATTPLFLESATLIDLPTMPAADGAPIVCVADELQALLVEQEIGDCVSVIALASPDETPGDDAADALKSAKPFLVVMPEGWENDVNAKGAWKAWSAAWPEAEPIELEHGMTVFEARRKGSDIRDWIFEKLPKDYVGEHVVGIELPAAGDTPGPDFMKGFKVPLPDDIPGLISGVFAELKGAMEDRMAPLKAKQTAALEEVSKTVAQVMDKPGVKGKLDVDLNAISLKPSGGSKASPSQIGKDMAAKMRSERDRLKQLGKLPPDAEKALSEGANKAEALGKQSEAMQKELSSQYEAKQQELAAGMEKLKNRELPPEAQAKFDEHGIDTDKIRPLSREQVKRIHDQGRSLAGYILSGVDLSELDLSGADFTGCRLKKTVFANAVLDGAVFAKALGKEADFSEASLKGANFEMGIFNKAKFAGADLSGARCRQAVFKEADVSGALFNNVDFSMAALEKVNGKEANLSNGTFDLSLMSGDFSGADFRHTKMNKCLLNKAVVDGADFRHATLAQTQFNEVKGEKVTFANANLDKFRTGNNTELCGADFSHASMHQAVLRDSDLSGANFEYAKMNEAMVENSMLVGANFNRVEAKVARFTKSNLEGATMRGANLFTGSLRKARLVDADLRGSNFYAVDFYKAVLGNTRFDASNLKKSHLENRLDLLDD